MYIELKHKYRLEDGTNIYPNKLENKNQSH